MEITLSDGFYKELAQYCEINNLDIEKYLRELFIKDKFGDRPFPIEKRNKKKEEKPKKEKTEVVESKEKVVEAIKVIENKDEVVTHEKEVPTNDENKEINTVPVIKRRKLK